MMAIVKFGGGCLAMPQDLIIHGRYVNHAFIPDGPLPDAEGKAELIITPTQNTPTWPGWFEKLESLHSLKDGWNGYTAASPNAKSIENAHLFLQVMQLEAAEPTRVAPSAMGGVAITRRIGNRKVFVEFYNDGRVYSLFSEKSSEMNVVPVAADSLSFRALIANM
jgi:hypothetical protein